jgi:RNA methyltransferase, TrmH family
MPTIASSQNPRLKTLRRLQTKRGRAQSRRFFAEGEDLIAAGEAAGREAVDGYRLAGSGLGGRGFHDVEAEALAAVSTLGSGTRAIGVYEQRWMKAPVGPVCVYLHGVGDPGNVGTVLRGVQAFGGSCVALGPGCADPHSPKAVRASMGAIFAVDLVTVADVAELPRERVALVAGAGESLADVCASLTESESESGAGAGGISLLVGAEREGLPEDVVGTCERIAHIPIEAESLNAAMACTVALYEVAHARAGWPSGTRTSRVRAS